MCAGWSVWMGEKKMHVSFKNVRACPGREGLPESTGISHPWRLPESARGREGGFRRWGPLLFLLRPSQQVWVSPARLQASQQFAKARLSPLPRSVSSHAGLQQKGRGHGRHGRASGTRPAGAPPQLPARPPAALTPSQPLPSLSSPQRPICTTYTVELSCKFKSINAYLGTQGKKKKI